MSEPYPSAVRPVYDDAVELLARFGAHAIDEASQRANSSRNAGNVIRFCHWRQTARTIAALRSTEVLGALH